MNARQQYHFDREYLRRCKESAPEKKLEWLAAAVEFMRAPKKSHSAKRKPPQKRVP